MSKLNELKALLDQAKTELKDVTVSLDQLGLKSKDFTQAMGDKTGQTADIVFDTIMMSNPYTSVIHTIAGFLEGLFGGNAKPFDFPFVKLTYDDISNAKGNDGKPIDKYQLPMINGSLDWLLMSTDTVAGNRVAQASGLGNKGKLFAKVMTALGTKVLKKNRPNLTVGQSVDLFTAVEKGAKIAFLNGEILDLVPSGGTTEGKPLKGGSGANPRNKIPFNKSYSPFTQRNDKSPNQNNNSLGGLLVPIIALYLISKLF